MSTRFVLTTVLLFYFRLPRATAQPCDPGLDYHIYFNGSSLFTVSSSNGTCFCDSFASIGGGTLGPGLSTTAGLTRVSSPLLVQQFANFQAGMNVSGLTAFRGPTTFTAPVSATAGLTVSPRLQVDGTSNITGRANFMAAVDFGGGLSASSGNFAGTLTASTLNAGATTVTSLLVNGAVTASASVTVSQNVTAAGAIRAGSFQGDGSRLTNLRTQPDIVAMNSSLAQAMAAIQSLTDRVNTVTLQLTIQTETASAATTQLCTLDNFNFINNITILNNTLLIMGGGWNANPTAVAPNNPGPEATTIVEYYNPLCNVWRTGPPSPVRHKYAGAVVYKGELWLLAGFDNTQYGKQVQKYNPLTATWTVMTYLPVGRQAVAAAVANGQIHVFGGRTGQFVGQSQYNDMWNDTGVWYSMAPMPTGRRGAVAVSLNDLIYVVGGAYTVGPTTVLSTNEIYNPATNTWSTGANMLNPRNSHCAVAFNGELWVLGGDDNGQMYSNVQIYTPGTNSWAPGPPLLGPRTQFAAGVVGGRLYVCGGTRVLGNAVPWQPNKSCEMYNPVVGNWSYVADMPTARIAAVGAGLGPF